MTDAGARRGGLVLPLGGVVLGAAFVAAGVVGFVGGAGPIVAGICAVGGLLVIGGAIVALVRR